MDTTRPRLRLIVTIAAAVVAALGFIALGAFLSDDSGRVEELLAEVAGLQAMVDEQEQERAALEDSLNETASTVDANGEELAAVLEENAALSAEIAEMQREIDSIAAEDDAQAAELAEAEARVEVQIARVAALEAYFSEELAALTTEAQRQAITRACNAATEALESGATLPDPEAVAATVEALYGGIVVLDRDPIEREVRRCGRGENPATSTSTSASSTSSTATEPSSTSTTG